MGLEIYKKMNWKTLEKEWRWRLTGGNNKIVAASTESFKNKIDCEHNIEITIKGLNLWVQATKTPEAPKGNTSKTTTNKPSKA